MEESLASRSPLRICEEPFRIFYPVGALLGLAGVSLWVLFYLGAPIPYPNVAHARLMIEGFMASFMFGFLGTAGPRLISAPPFSLPEVMILFTLDLLAAGAHAGGADRFGDICFTVCLCLFVWTLGKRFRQRKDSPPPNFVLVALGFLSGIVGAALLVFSEAAQYSRTYFIGSALLNECFVLLPILGVAPFFIGRLLDLPSPDLPESRSFPPAWKRQAAFAGLIGVFVIGSFFLEMFAWPRMAGWVRLVAVAVYVAVRMPFRGRAFLANSLRGGLLSIVTGLTLVALLPVYRVGALHVVFITGFNLIVYTVAIRVVFGHSGNLAQLQKRLWFFIVTTGLLFLAMTSRFTADLAPAARVVHLLSAAFCWLAASLIWMLKVIPKIAPIEPKD